MTKGFFVTATDTEAGKTYISALLIKALKERGLKTGYFKAALSGDENGLNDGTYVIDSCGLDTALEEAVAFRYRTPVSPHLAGRLENSPFDLSAAAGVWQGVRDNYRAVVAEGSGGIVCPLRWDDEAKVMLADVIRLTALPLIIVVPCRVGAINAAVLTGAYCRGIGLPPLGFILNYFQERDPIHRDNAKMIEELTGLPILARVSMGAESIEIEKLLSLQGEPLK
ncbi:MAG: dethiobiotin synthase [Bacillota bacterium]|nr:dethiobiotin synthase [Bacillota bacterium]